MNLSWATLGLAGLAICVPTARLLMQLEYDPAGQWNDYHAYWLAGRLVAAGTAPYDGRAFAELADRAGFVCSYFQCLTLPAEEFGATALAPDDQEVGQRSQSGRRSARRVAHALGRPPARRRETGLQELHPVRHVERVRGVRCRARAPR